MNNTQPFYINEHYKNIILNVIQTSLIKNKRVTCFRFDIRYPLDAQYLQFQPGNITKFVNSLKAKLFVDIKNKLKKWGKNPDFKYNIDYVWVQEVGRQNNNLHFHFLLLLPKDLYHSFGSFKPSNNRSLATLINEAWASALKLRNEDFMKQIHFGLVTYINLQEGLGKKLRNSTNFRNSILYMAKDATKEPGHGNNIDHSQIIPEVFYPIQRDY